MSAVLALVGCGPRLEVGLGLEGSGTPWVIALAGPTPRSELVMAAIDLLLRAASLRVQDLAGVLATRGPGSFTGIRVALATAQGLASALGLEARGLPSLLVQAARVDAERCRAVQPARRGFAYIQDFALRGGRPAPLGEPGIGSVAALEGSPIGIVGPDGFALPPAAPRLTGRRCAAEALLALGRHAEPFDATTLVPCYLEPAPVTPRARKG